MTGIDYSDGTPDVAFTYDRLGRQKTADSSVSAHTFAYNGLLLDTETVVANGTTNVIDRAYDSLGRSTGFSLSDSSGTSYLSEYSYDSYGRFNNVGAVLSAATNSFSYSYLENSDLLAGYSDSASGLQVSRTYEQNRNLLTQIKNEIDSTLISQYDYINDNGGRRTSVKHSGTAFLDSAFNKYGYNNRSEVTSANRYWGTDLNDTNNPVGLQAYTYAYDNIGNRTSAKVGGASMLRNYTANSLNQYTQQTVPGYADIIGSATTQATVTVNSQPVNRQGQYWYKELGVTNTAGAVYTNITVMGVYNPPDTNAPDVVTVESGKVFVAKTPESFTYDNDGNSLSDGRFNYTWDCENRLIQVETSTNLPSSVPVQLLSFSYDYMGRRLSKTVYNWVSNDWVEVEARANVFNGWDLLREKVVASQQTTTNWYVHGLDLSGSLSGAGGIGGLLVARLGTNDVCYTYDGNGNVSELADTSTGDISAHYEYSPFGEAIVSTGPLAKENKFRFSTKYFCDEFGMGDWGMRWYHPDLGRWMRRDPLREKGSQHAFPVLYQQNPSATPVTLVDHILFSLRSTTGGSKTLRIDPNISRARTRQDIYSLFKLQYRTGSIEIIPKHIRLADGRIIDFKASDKAAFERGAAILSQQKESSRKESEYLGLLNNAIANIDPLGAIAVVSCGLGTCSCEFGSEWDSGCAPSSQGEAACTASTCWYSGAKMACVWSYVRTD